MIAPHPVVRLASRCASLCLAAVLAATCSSDEVTAPPAPVVSEVVLSTDTMIIPAIGFERVLAASVTGEDGQPATGASLIWGSRSPEIVQVVSPGVVRARALGEALVIVSAGDVADTALVRVMQVPEVFTVEGPDTIWSVNGKAVLTVTKVDSTGVPIPDAPTWTSSNPEVAVGYNSGGDIPAVRAYGVGDATITATLQGISASFDVAVRQRETGFSFGYRGNELTVGDTMSVRVHVVDASSVEIFGLEVEWSTNDSTIGRIDAEGLVTAVGSGNLFITARVGSLEGQAMLPVLPPTPPPGDLTVSPVSYHSEGWGEQILLQAFVVDGISPPTSVPATWTSRDESVATVNRYFATTQGDGSTWLVAQYDGRTDSVAIEVERVPVAVTFQGVPQELFVTFTSGIDVYPATVDRFGGVHHDHAAIAWTVRDTSVIRADALGIGAVGGGSTWVRVDIAGLADSLHITVIPQWGGNFPISNDADMAYFVDLGIEEVVGAVRIAETNLTSLDGLETLRRVDGEIRVSSNPSLTDMSALADLEAVTGPIIIEDNPLLTVSLPGLREAGSLKVFRNQAIQSHSFAALERVSAELDIGDSGPEMYFESLTAAGSMMWNGSSPSAVHYPVLERIMNDLTLLDADLVSFSAPQLWCARSISIRSNALLTTLDLPSLTTITRDLEIIDNAVLVTLDDFSSLTSGVRRLRIHDNDVLNSIDGLRQLGDALGSDPIVFESWRIKDNPLLGTTAAFIQFLEDKFPGEGVPNSSLP